MKTLVRIKGYVSHADMLEPFTAYPEDLVRYELHLFPQSFDVFCDLEHRIEELKQEHEQKQSPYCERHYHLVEHPGVKDRVFAGDCIKFESLYSPRLEGELSSLTHDDEFRGKYVQVVGHLQIQELGNCFLSFHIVEPAVHPAEGFDL